MEVVNHISFEKSSQKLHYNDSFSLNIPHTHKLKGAPVTSNPLKATNIIVVNGYSSDIFAFAYQVDNITNITGSNEVTAVVNISPNIFYQERNLSIACAIFSNAINCDRISQLTTRIIKQIGRGNYQKKKNIIFCYSQGALIANLAVKRLKKILPKKAFQKLAKKIEIYALGTAILSWPKEIKVFSFAFKNDIFLTPFKPISLFNKKFKTGKNQTIVDSLTIPSPLSTTSHDIFKYIEAFPSFIVEGLKNKPAKEVATFLYEKINNGIFSDWVISEILRLLYYDSRYNAIKELLDISNNGKIGNLNLKEVAPNVN